MIRAEESSIRGSVVEQHGLVDASEAFVAFLTRSGLTFCTKCLKIISAEVESYVVVETRESHRGVEQEEKRYALHRVCSECRAETMLLHETTHEDRDQHGVMYAHDVYAAVWIEDGYWQRNGQEWEPVSDQTVNYMLLPIPMAEVFERYPHVREALEQSERLKSIDAKTIPVAS